MFDLGFSNRRRLRIGLEVLTGSGWTGGAQYIRNLIYCFDALPRSEQPLIKLISDDPNDDNLRDLLRLPFVEHDHSAKHLWRRLMERLDRQGRNESELDVTYPGFGSPVPGVPQIKWLPDFQHAYLPRFFSPEELDERAKSDFDKANTPGLLILSSNAVMADFQRLHPDAVATPVVWSFCSSIPRFKKPVQSTNYELPEKFAYLPNQFWAHKDHLTAFRAIAYLKERGLELPLICTGLEEDSRNPLHFMALMRFVEEQHLGGHIKCLGLVPRNDQIEIFRRAAIVIQPSLFEGWSTVVEDTKAIGRPIICSDLSTHQEQLIGYDQAWFFKQESPMELALLLETLWNDLQPGPDFRTEKLAAERALTQRRSAARNFLTLARLAKKMYQQRSAHA